jgi:hypothetical protein
MIRAGRSPTFGASLWVVSPRRVRRTAKDPWAVAEGLMMPEGESAKEYCFVSKICGSFGVLEVCRGYGTGISLRCGKSLAFTDVQLMPMFPK